MSGSGPPLTERSAVELAAAIRAGQLSSRQVVEAHIALAEKLNPKLNALVATRFDQARAEADAADRRVTSAGGDDVLPPLLGVPCTIKESFALEGMPNSSGLAKRSELRAASDAVAVARLREAGAIPLGVTNLSELTLWVESDNPLYGRTNNAYDSRRTAGGSSGGEGAAVGSGISPFGLGTDFGGSIRLPAFFNGVYGHKPTARLVPHEGHYPAPNERGEELLGTGPLTRRAEDLWPLMEVLAGQPSRLGDPGEVSIEGLAVTIVDRPTIIPVSRSLQAAVEQAAGALRASGAEVRRLRIPGLKTVMAPYLAAVSQSGGLRELLEEDGTELDPFHRLLRDWARGSGHSTPLLLTLLAEMSSGHLPDAWLRTNAKAEARLRERVSEAIGDGVILHPPFARVAPRHRRTFGRTWMLGPMAAFNLLGLPATQVPAGLDSRRLPLGLQVIAGRDRDHVSIAVAMELERSLGGWVPPSG